MKIKQIKTPELDKILLVRDASQKIGEFLEWLNEQGIELMTQPKEKCSNCYECESCGGVMMEYVRFNKEQKLADFFEIDLVKCEKERQAILDDCQNQE
jgi:hypothetical protein